MSKRIIEICDDCGEELEENKTFHFHVSIGIAIPVGTVLCCQQKPGSV